MKTIIAALLVIGTILGSEGRHHGHTSSKGQACDRRPCEEWQVCVNHKNGFSCLCQEGYHGSKCDEDVDECMTGEHLCDEHATCQNTFGSYTCTCTEGFQGDGSYCREIVCQDIHGIKDGDVDVPRPAPAHSHATFTCHPGLHLVGQHIITCLPTGRWSAAPPRCETILCNPINPIPNGLVYLSHDTAYVGVQAAFRCNDGFHLIGPTQVTCQQNGQWSSTVPTCQVVTCPSPGLLANGDVQVVHPARVHSVAAFKCNQGFDLVGLPVISCGEDGRWSGPPPVCTATLCRPLSAPVDGEMLPPEENIYGSMARFRCRPGFNMVGQGTITCLTSGKWSAPEPTCEDVNECLNNVNCEGKTQEECAILSRGGKGYNICSPEADCINTVGSYHCQCKDGYAGDGVHCADIDECAQQEYPCHNHATCINMPGGFSCTCVYDKDKGQGCLETPGYQESPDYGDHGHHGNGHHGNDHLHDDAGGHAPLPGDGADYSNLDAHGNENAVNYGTGHNGNEIHHVRPLLKKRALKIPAKKSRMKREKPLQEGEDTRTQEESTVEPKKENGKPVGDKKKAISQIKERIQALKDRLQGDNRPAEEQESDNDYNSPPAEVAEETGNEDYANEDAETQIEHQVKAEGGGHKGGWNDYLTHEEYYNADYADYEHVDDSDDSVGITVEQAGKAINVLSGATPKEGLREVWGSAGSKREIPCVPKGVKGAPPDVPDPNYRWTYGKHREVSGHRYEIADTGELTISHLMANDSGTYHCHLKFKDGKGGGARTHRMDLKHRVQVGHLVKYGYSVKLSYTATSCAQSLHRESERISDVLNQMCEKHKCSVVNFTMSCSHNHDIEDLYNLRYSSHLLRITYGLFREEDCTVVHLLQNKENACLLTKILDVLDMTLGTEISEMTTSIDPSENVFSRVLYCKAGYGLNYGAKAVKGLCGACAPQHYSPAWDWHCHPCPRGEYQPAHGAHSCNRCPPGLKNIRVDRNGTATGLECYDEDFMTIVAIIVCATAGLLVLAVCVPCILLRLIYKSAYDKATKKVLRCCDGLKTLLTMPFRKPKVNVKLEPATEDTNVNDILSQYGSRTSLKRKQSKEGSKGCSDVRTATLASVRTSERLIINMSDGEPNAKAHMI
ncbi:Sushi, von Willebrand factor type A, EGF and pentraxin [Branchiostoma belcheri]|nr:Sushi, von Willebrand factor type A, EGF and pentraxin [Branchiostoma belcheri]